MICSVKGAMKWIGIDFDRIDAAFGHSLTTLMESQRPYRPIDRHRTEQAHLEP